MSDVSKFLAFADDLVLWLREADRPFPATCQEFYACVKQMAAESEPSADDPADVLSVKGPGMVKARSVGKVIGEARKIRLHGVNLGLASRGRQVVQVVRFLVDSETDVERLLELVDRHSEGVRKAA